MAAYIYSDESGEIHEMQFPFGTAPNQVLLANGKTATRDFRAEYLVGGHKTASPSSYPFASTAAGCHREQIPIFRKHLAEKGVPTDYTPDGRPIFTDPKHRSKALKELGLYDRSAGYGDPTPTTHTGDTK